MKQTATKVRWAFQGPSGAGSIEVLTGVKSTAQICREHGIKETLLSRWKQEFIERSADVFERRRE